MRGRMIDLDSENPTFIDPDILKKELVISLPILSESDVQRLLHGADYSHAESASSDEEEPEKPCLKRDQRRLKLLNNPDYGIILCFIDKFRSYINMKKYPLRILEDNLISEKEKLSHRFIDFHLALLKKVNSGKTTRPDQFFSSITKFAYRFNREDGDHLEDHGYPKANVDIKLRVLKNLLEKQFECDTHLKNAMINKSPIEIRAKPFGRDRYGASYWLYTDTDCFFRLFRENIDKNCAWTCVAKDQNELENIIKLLLTDHIVRKKFPRWKFSYASFNALKPSHEFEERYASNLFNCKNKDELTDGAISSYVLFHSGLIKAEHIDFDPIVNLDRNLPPSSPEQTPVTNDTEQKDDVDSESDNDSVNSVEIGGSRLNKLSSMDTGDDMYSLDLSQDSSSDHLKNDDSENTIKEIENQSKSDNDDAQVTTLKTSTDEAVKLKLVDYDDSESQNETEDNEKHHEPSEDSDHSIITRKPQINNDLPIALRRSRRSRRSCATELSRSSSSTTLSGIQSSKRKRSIDKVWKGPSLSSITNSRFHRKSRRRGNTSSTSDEQYNDDDDDFSDDYLQTNKELDDFLNGDLLNEEDDENDQDYVSHRRARTVAQCQEKYDASLKECIVCSQRNNLDTLLLCEDCDDAYHLQCLVPELLSIPYNNWYCPLCDHKHLCEGLIEKLHILIQDQHEYEMKRRLFISKRRKRLTNVCVNVDRYVQQPTKDTQKKLIVSSDEDENEQKNDSTHEDDAFFGFRVTTNNDSTGDEDSNYPYISNKQRHITYYGNSTSESKNKTNNDSANDDDSVYGSKSKKTTKTIDIEDNTHESNNKKTTNSINDTNNSSESKSKKKDDSTNDEDSVYGSKTNKKADSTNDEDSVYGDKSKKKNKPIHDEDSLCSSKSRKKNDSTNDDDSVYGSKNDENRKPSDEEQDQSGKRRVRACRRKATTYSYDDYDKKIKDALISSGVNKKLIEGDSDDSDEVTTSNKKSKKRTRHEVDEDFDLSETKRKDDYVPSSNRRRRPANEDSRSETRDAQSRDNFEYSNDFNDFNDDNDFGMSDDDSAWINRRKSFVSSTSKKKTNSKANRSNSRRSTNKSDTDSNTSEATIEYCPAEISVKSEPITEYDQNTMPTNGVYRNGFDINSIVDHSFDENSTTNHSFDQAPATKNQQDKPPAANNKKKRTPAAKPPREKPPPSKKAKQPKATNNNTTTDPNSTTENGTNKKQAPKEPKPRPPRPPRKAPPKKKVMIQEEHASGEEDVPVEPRKRRTIRKYRDDNESSVDEADDYERLAHKRRLYTQGKTTTRTRITDHIKKLVGTEETEDEDEEEDEEEKEKEKEDNGDEKPAETKKDKNNNTKEPKVQSLDDEYLISDDDDFPDEEEIIKTTGLKNLKTAAPAPVPKPPVFQASYMSAMPSYHFMMSDPTANFDLTCMPEPSLTEPSDPNHDNANNSQTTAN